MDNCVISLKSKHIILYLRVCATIIIEPVRIAHLLAEGLRHVSEHLIGSERVFSLHLLLLLWALGVERPVAVADA